MMTKFDYMERTRKLKEADAHIQRRLGVNHSLGYATNWGATPRTGARWSEAESNELHFIMTRSHDDLRAVDPRRKLGAGDLAVLAWHFGRTANAINEQLFKLLGAREYFNRIEI